MYKLRSTITNSFITNKYVLSLLIFYLLIILILGCQKMIETEERSPQTLRGKLNIST